MSIFSHTGVLVASVTSLRITVDPQPVVIREHREWAETKDAARRSTQTAECMLRRRDSLKVLGSKVSSGDASWNHGSEDAVWRATLGTENCQSARSADEEIT